MTTRTEVRFPRDGRYSFIVLSFAKFTSARYTPIIPPLLKTMRMFVINSQICIDVKFLPCISLLQNYMLVYYPPKNIEETV